VDQTAEPVKADENVVEAALDLGHRPYSGTGAATVRRTEADEVRK